MKTKHILYIWGALFALCAGLGFLPREEIGWGWVLTLLSILFFVPPGVLLYRARTRNRAQLRLLVRNLSAISLGLTLVLLIANFLSVMGSEALGRFLHGLLTVLSAPMICSGCWALSIFLWACLLVASMRK